MSFWKFGDPVDFGEGYRELEDGEIVPKGAETFMGKKWDPVDGAVGAPYKRARKGRARYHFPIRVKGAPIEPVEFPKMPESPRCLWEGWRSCSSEEASRMLSGSHSRDLLRVEYWDPGFKRWLGAGGVDRDGHEPFKYRVRWLSQNEVTGATKETGAAPNWHDNLFPDIPTPKDPKTKYHRPMYPAWNDTEVHTDANGHKHINVDVYSVLAAFDPGHEVAHAVKKLLAAGSRDKGSKIQDYREAIISIEAAIYRAEIEGGAG